MQQTGAWSDQVFTQLERILNSKEFKRSNRLGRFLAYVVEQTLLHEPKSIRSYNIAVEVYGKGLDFDPGDPYVRNIAQQVRRRLKSFYASAGAYDKIRVDVPAGNYIATFVVLEDTAVAGVAEPSRSTDSEGAPAIEIVDSAADTSDPERINGLKPSIAVIPFKYQGDDSDGELVVGEILATGLIAGLSKSPRLNVISWLSTTQFRNTQSNVLDVSRKLKCDYVMSGSYRCQGNRLSIFVEIADSVSLEVIWSEMMQSTVNNLLSCEPELVSELINLAARVVLDRELYRAFNEPLESLSLHTKLIGGMRDMHSKANPRFDNVKILFEQILERYPTHATVNALLAHWYVLKINRGGGWQGVDDTRKNFASQSYLQTALEANPNHAFALTIQGLVETQFNNDPEKGLNLYDTAEQLNPNEPVLMAYKAAVLSYKGWGKEAIRFANKAIALSPFDPQLSLFHTCAAAAYYAGGDCDSAKYHADRAYKLNPVHTSNLRTLVAIQVDLGEIARARSSARELLLIDPGFTTGSYLRQSPSGGYKVGQQIADRLGQAGIPAA